MWPLAWEPEDVKGTWQGLKATHQGPGRVKAGKERNELEVKGGQAFPSVKAAAKGHCP